MGKLLAAWCNEKTGQTDWLEGLPIDFRPYIPQIPAALGMFECYLQIGLAPVDAYIKTLKACLGEKDDDPKAV